MISEEAETKKENKSTDDKRIIRITENKEESINKNRNRVSNEMRLEFKEILRKRRELVRAEEEYRINKIYNDTLLEDRLKK